MANGAFPSIQLPPGGIPLDEEGNPIMPSASPPPMPRQTSGTIPLFTPFQPPSPPPAQVAVPPPMQLRGLASRGRFQTRFTAPTPEAQPEEFTEELPSEAAPAGPSAPPAPPGPQFRRITQARPTSPESRAAEADLERSQQQIQQAVGKEAEANVALAGATEEAAARKLEDLNRLETERQQAADRRQQARQASGEIVARKEKELADFKVRGFWENKSTGTKIFAAIIQGLGAFAEAASGGRARNMSTEIINKAIEDDLALQREKRAGLQEQVELARQGDDRARLLLAGEEIEEDTKRIRALEIASAFAGTAAAKAGTQLARAQAERQQAELQNQAQALRVDRERKLDDFVASRERVVQYGGDGAPGVPGATQVGGVRGEGGQVMFTTGDQKRDESLQEGVDAYRELKTLIADQKKSFAPGGPGAEAFGEEKAAREARFGDAATLLRTMEKSGALDRGSVEITEKRFPTNTGRFFGRGEALAKLEQFEKNLDRKTLLRLQGAGVQNAGDVVRSLGGVADQRAPIAVEERAALVQVIRDPNASPTDKARARQVLGGSAR